ncbi:hypothetical protein SAMN04487948_108140 [Halogranum amylolyticum]|uniref:Uncharacterized protein n=1 Tax=Halogranum amylolyticum TaxID=660520 RepID=A0A1H8TVU4_9EURY|nr:DUF5807 family protein [Halogranum amylolyticum]SEO94704.1 hypothetical protein SAMN04487948_108140 [Halogranum amylolyticum]
MSKLDEFLAGERLEDVALFLTHEYLDEEGKIANYGQEVENGVVLVVDGDDGRGMFASGTGMDAMEFAQGAMGNRGEIGADLGGGDCPEAEPDENHNVKFVFAFAEEQNEEVGGLYEEGDVIHAYAQCECGTAYSDRWVVGEK